MKISEKSTIKSHKNFYENFKLNNKQKINF